MASFFELLLDTQTQLGVSINGGSANTLIDTVTLELAFDEDAIEVKIWGDINPLDPANEDYGETEEDAPWITVSPSFLVNVTTNPGQKRLSARVRDDVLNEEVATDTILFGEQTAVPVTQRPTLLPGKPEPEPEPLEAEEVLVTSRIEITSSAQVGAFMALSDQGPDIGNGGSVVEVSTATASEGFQIRTSVQSYITRDASPSTLTVGADTAATIRRGDGPTIEALDLLDLL